MLRSLQPRLVALNLLPLRMPLGGKKAGRDKGPRKTGELSSEVATGCALMKGEEDPKLLPNDQYPPWLFKLLQPPPAAGLLEKKYEGTGLSLMEMQRLWRLKNKERIRDVNASKAK
eukprot:gene6868-30843_t